MFAALSTAEWITTSALALTTLLALVGGALLLHGVFQARSLIRRELAGYFLSPIGYVVFVVFLAVTGHLFSLTVDQLTTTGPEGVEDPFRFMFGDERFWLVFLFIPPLLTMRSFAEERASGTLEMLMTAPLRDWQLVLAKYSACLTFYVLLWLPTLLYLPLLLNVQLEQAQPVWTPHSLTLLAGLAASCLGFLLLIPRVGTPLRLISLLLFVGGLIAASLGGWLHARHDTEHLLTFSLGLDPAAALTLYLGMFLAGAMFLAIGLFVSSLVRDQLVSALIALALSLVFIVPGFWRPNLDGGSQLDELVYFFSVPLHFGRTFTRGLLDTRPLVLYVSVTIFFLFLTVRSLESRRWR